MAKDRKKLQHIHSSVPDKQPTPSTLEVGEIAVNNAEDKEFLSIKNTNDKVVRFSSDEQIIDWVEKKEVVPYKGQVRGEVGPEGTVDSFGSYGITNNDLIGNKSNIVIKLNQVVAGNTPKHGDINGSKDIYNKSVNPTSDSGYTDGAGFAIDMSRYAMIGANPSFSSLTVTDKTDLSGNTTITNGDGTGTRTGHTLMVTTTNATFSNDDYKQTATTRTATIGTDTTKVSGDSSLDITGTTSIVRRGNVTETNVNSKTVTTNGSVTTNTSGDTIENKKGNVTENTTGVTTVNRFNNVFENNSSAVTVVTSGTTTETKIGDVTENHSGSTTENKKGNVVENNFADKTINTSGNITTHTVGTKTSTNDGNVTETNLSNKTVNTSGNTTENVKGNVNVNITGTTTEVKTGAVTETNSSTTNLTRVGAVTITNNATKTETTDGVVTENNKSTHNINTTGATNITRTGIVTEDNKNNVVRTTSGTTTETFKGQVTENNQSGYTVNTTGDVIVNTTGTTTEVKVGNVKESHSGTTTIDRKGIVSENNQSTYTLVTSGATTETKIGNVTENHSGTTTENKKGIVIENNLSAKTENTTGVLTENNSSNYNVNTTGNTTVVSTGSTTIETNGENNKVTIQSTGNGGDVEVFAKDTLCESAGTTAAFVGATKTNIGKNCADGGQTTTLNINGTTINETGTTINVSGTTINVDAVNYDLDATNVCVSGSTKANFYGSTTNVGVDCGGTTATTINVSGTTINEGGTTLNENFTNGNFNITNYDLNGANICVSGSTKANVYGATTNVGIDCNGSTTATTVNISGATINEGGATNNNNFTTINNTTTTINNKVTNFNISGTTNISGDTNITGNTNITNNLNVTGNTNISGTTHFKNDVYIDNGKKLYFTPDCTSELSSTTVNAALCEVMNRGEVTFKVGDYAATDENLKWYELWQNGKQVKDQNGNTVRIDIPKDHILKDVAIVNGHASGSSFTACTAGDKTCEWYIKLVWNVFNPSTGHSDDKTVYLPANNLVQDHSFDDTNAINFTTDYDGQKIHVSADTTVKIVTPNGDKTFSKSNAVHSLNSYKLNITHNGLTNAEFDPFKASTALTLPHSSLTWTYEATSGKSGTDSFNTSADKSISIPTAVNHLNRGKFTVVHNGLTDTFDPASDKSVTLPHSALTIEYGVDVTSKTNDSYNTSANKTVSVPTAVSHISRGTLSYSHNGFSGTFDPASNATFTSPHSALTINYGVNVGDRSSSTTYNTSAATTVDIPSKLGDLGSRGKLTLVHNGLSYDYIPGASTSLTAPHNSLTATYEATSGKSGSVTFNTSADKNISIPTCVSHLNRRTLTWSNGSANTGTYDPGASCDNTNSGTNIVIPSSLSHLSDWSSSCLNISNNLCVNGTITSTGGMYTSSDETLKDDIHYIRGEEISRVSKVELKSFYYKSDPSRRKVYGVIAQDVERLGLEELVHYDENGIRSVDYTGLLLLKIAALEKEISILKNKFDEEK